MSVHQSYGFPLNIFVRTDVGRVRTNNEDSHAHAWLDDGSLFAVVADGMGGHEAGEVASGLAVRVLEEVVRRDPDADPRERLYNGLLEVNEAILDEGRASGTKGMGTTAVACIFKGSTAFPAQIGDSRIYHIRNGHVIWRTSDHTRVQHLVDQGQIDDEEARVHPQAGMLTRALGHSKMADGRPLTPDVFSDPIQLEEGDAIVICSDGLHDLLDDWEISKIVAGSSPESATQVLIDAACERGGHDNITVAMIIAGEKAFPYDDSYLPPNYLVEAPPEEVEHNSSLSTASSAAPTKDKKPMFVGVAALLGLFLFAGLAVISIAAGLTALWMSD